MRTAGVREARQNLSALLDEVKKGREVVITEHGRPVAKLVPVDRPRGKGIPNLAAIRRRMPVFDPPLSTTLAEVRDDARF
jgi:prevent-host-death family protein